MSMGYALARAELIHVLTAYSGITTSDGLGDGTTLLDANLIGKDSQKIVEKTILIMSGDAEWEDKGASAFDTGTGKITLQGTGFSARITAGTIFRILNISSVEIDVANIKTVVDAILVDTSTTLEAKLDAIAAYIDTEVAAIETKLDTPANFMADVSALALEATLATADAKVSYTEDSASGNSGGDGAWHDALDIDTRGMKSFSAVVTNTDGANSLNWRLRARPSNYSAGADEEIPECPGSETLAPAEMGLAELIKAYSRIKIQVQDTVAMSAATYTIDYLINR